MCGIAGRILSSTGTVGADLVDLMEAQRHRGADSTGFAVYGPPVDEGYIVRAMGADRSKLSADLDDFLGILREHGSDFLSDPTFPAPDQRPLTRCDRRGEQEEPVTILECQPSRQRLDKLDELTRLQHLIPVGGLVAGNARSVTTVDQGPRV